ncbi:MAG: glycosyltransferase family 2 protein [Thermodesulfobacteriota bacterium]|nr:glycosyltransferase family 2 protein [Thermodesulfobacteriota bacterium]
MDNMKVSVIIPAYNEEQNIERVVKKIVTLYPDFELIVVDDGSSDNTARVAKNAGALVYSHPYNIGNGAAIKSGIRFASGDILVFMDGDGQHEPEEIGKILKYFPDFDMVVGARPKGKQTSWIRTLGNKFYNWLATYVAKLPIKDLTSGFRAVRSDIAHNFLYLLPNSYSYTTTLTLGVLRSGRSVQYIPINIKNRNDGKSKIKIFKDGIRFFLIIIKICIFYSPLRVFVPISVFMFILGLVNYLYTYLTTGRFTNMSALLFTTSVLIFLLGLISEQICQIRFERTEGDKFV